jgi:hypothetical protein
MDLVLPNLIRTLSSYFRVGTLRLKDASGTLAIRNGGDSADASISADELTLATPLATDFGGTGADLSTADGAIVLSAGAVGLVKHNFSAVVAPTTSDDDGSDYVPGSMWIDTALNNIYICADNTTSAAVWVQLN